MTRCGIDTVEIARVERWLQAASDKELLDIFSREEMDDAGEGPGRTASLAARFAAKEACLKLFPRETALGLIDPADFSIAPDGYGAPQILCSAKAQELLDRYGFKALAVSLTHDTSNVTAMVAADPA